MGRPFQVEFDGIDTGKFYTCRMCRTPFARNIDAYHYMKWGGEAAGGEAAGDFVSISYMWRVSNVLDSDIIRVIRNDHQEYDLQEIHCISCNNQVGYKFKDLVPWATQEFYSLLSDKIWYLINGEDHYPETVAFEDWFYQLPPPDDTIQIQ